CDLAPFFVGQTTILRRTDDKAMIEFLATNQLFVDVRPAITNVRPLDLFVCRRVAESKTGLLPPLRFARTPLHEFGIVRRFAFRTRLTHVVVLHRQTQDLDCWTTWPTLGLIGFTLPAHGQHRMQMETLQPGGAAANRSKPLDRLMSRPRYFAGIFQDQVTAWLVHLLKHHFTMSLLQVLRRGIRVAEKGVGCLNIRTANEDLRNALIRGNGYGGSNGNGPLISARIAQIDLAEMPLCPCGRGFLMYRRKVQEVRSSFCWVSNFQPEFRAKFWVMTRL